MEITRQSVSVQLKKTSNTGEKAREEVPYILDTRNVLSYLIYMYFI